MHSADHAGLKKRYLHNPLSFALEWFFSLPSYLLQQNYFLDFTHFNLEELDLTDQRFFWNRNVVNWRRDHFLLWIVCISARGKVIGNFTFSRGKKVGNVTPHSNGKYVLPRNNIKRLKGTYIWIYVYEEFWKLFDELSYNFFW